MTDTCAALHWPAGMGWMGCTLNAGHDGAHVWDFGPSCPDCERPEAAHLSADECEAEGLDTRDGLGCIIRNGAGEIVRAFVLR